MILATGLSVVNSSLGEPVRTHIQTEKAKAQVRQIDAEGFKTLLKSSPGHPLLINFWATWCEPCREEFPDLVQIDARYRKQGLQMITVSLDDLADIQTAVPKFLREMRATMPAYLLTTSDADEAITAVDPRWSGALPATFLYDSQAKLTHKQFGRINPPELRSAIERLLSNKQ